MTVLIPALTIVKTADVSTTSPGGVVHYTVTVTNSGQTPYTGATYTDQMDGVLGDATYNGDAAATVGSVSFASPNMTWTGNLAAGASATVTYSVTVNNPDTGDLILTNTIVSATPGNNCPVGGTDPRCTVTVHDLVPGLDIVTGADRATATPGAVVHYTITVTNTGQTAYTGASFTDPLAGVLDDAAYNGDAAATAGTRQLRQPEPDLDREPGGRRGRDDHVLGDGEQSRRGQRQPGQHGHLRHRGEQLPGQRRHRPGLHRHGRRGQRDHADVHRDGGHGCGGGRRRGALHDHGGQLRADRVQRGHVHRRSGRGAGRRQPTTTTPRPPPARATFTSPTLTWTGNVPASGTVTITYSVTVNSPDTGNHILTSIITSTSAGSNCGAGSADPRCTATVDVAALSITATADVATTSPGSDVQYTVTADQHRPGLLLGHQHHPSTTPASSEDATYNGDLAATSGTLTVDSATGTATWTGDLAPGATVTITYSVTVIPPDADHNDKTLTLTVDSAALGNNCPAGGTDPACTAAVSVLVPALTITKTANTTAAVPGATVTYTITVADTGDTPYTGATVTDSLAGVLGDAAYGNDAAASAGAVSYASPVLTWTGNLTVGGTVTITYSVTVRNPDTGGKLMVNTVTSTTTGSTCPPGTTNAGCYPHRPGADPGPDHRQDRFGGHRRTRAEGDLHDHGHRHRPDPLHRRCRRPTP